MAERPKCAEVLAVLGDGEFHSGSELAERLQISRNAIWKHINRLRDYGAEPEAVTGKGYRLQPAVALLDEELLCTQLSARRDMRRLDVVWEIDSTNGELLRRAELGSVDGHVLLAEYQTAGRGRLGRSWLAPLASGVCLSIAWEFTLPPGALSALSLAAGVAVAEALQRLGATELGLKWPNDVVARQAKLAGILAEVKLEAGGRCVVVLGVGVNYALPMAAADAIDQPVIDLCRLLDPAPSRSALAAVLIDGLLTMLNTYASDGFGAYRDRWRAYDVVGGRDIVLRLPDGELAGRVCDVDADGALVVDVGGQPQRFRAGEVSLREMLP
jgi:BirA family biotin operon repressor/biotin-[acetyl-CoA-carboxylase] ligase